MAVQPTTTNAKPGPPAIRFAVSSLLWRNPNGDQLAPWLREVRSAGYDGIAGFAHWGWEAYVANPQPFAEVVSDHGLAVGSVMMRLDADLDQHRRVCDFLAAVNCRHLVCIDSKGKESGDFAAFGDLLNRIGEIAGERGIRAAYHNHTGGIGETFEDMDRLLAEIDPSKVAVMCDLGHATKDFVNQPPCERAIGFLRKYWDRIEFIEFKDWNPETDLATPVGEGLCDYQSVFALLKERSYRGWITVEQNGTSRGRTPFECARQSREYIRNGLGI